MRLKSIRGVVKQEDMEQFWVWPGQSKLVKGKVSHRGDQEVMRELGFFLVLQGHFTKNHGSKVAPPTLLLEVAGAAVTPGRLGLEGKTLFLREKDGEGEEQQEEDTEQNWVECMGGQYQ